MKKTGITTDDAEEGDHGDDEPTDEEPAGDGPADADTGAELPDE